MEVSEVANNPGREEVLASEDQIFSVKISFIRENILEIYPFGVANSQRIAEIQEKLADFLHQRSLSSPNATLYFLFKLDTIKVKSALRQFVGSALMPKFPFSKNVFIAFICKNYFQRLFWKLSLKGVIEVPYSFFESEVELNLFIEEKGKVISGKEKDALLEEFFCKEVVHYKNETFHILSKPDWEYKTEDSFFRYALVNEEVILLQMKGLVSKEMINESVRINKEIVRDLEGKKFVNLLELTNVTYPGWKIRKHAMVRAEETEHLWKQRIMVLNPLMAISYNTLKMAFPNYAETTNLVSNFSTAIDEYIRFRKKEELVRTEKKGGGAKENKRTSEELVKYIEELERNQEVRIRQLFEVFSRISWDETYKPLQIDVDEKDPFYSLFYAINYFQQDISEIINDQKELAQNLEEKVKERTQELHEKNHDLTKVNAELLKVNKELDQFVYSVSHDLRAPIASMKGLVNLLRLESSPETAQLYSQLISKNLDRLDFFIVEILELSRNSRLPLIKEPIKFKEIVENVFEELEHLGNAALIRKIIDIPESKDFQSDKHRIVVIFRNILSNAIKYSMPRFKESFIQISVSFDKEGALIQVKDNGIGIEENHLAKVFEMFYRATDQQAGSGLGLYIVKEMVEKLSGSIEVQSELGEGTTFTLKIPDLS